MTPGREPETPSAFYSGLVAELYDALVGERAAAGAYAPFLDRSGTPALELACGSGRPMLDLLARGYEVEGLDASADMLERCRAEAAASGLAPTLHLAEMQSFRLPRRYRSIFLAGASFNLLTTDEDAAAALGCMHAHLEAGGSALVPLEVPDADAVGRQVGQWREVTDASGCRLAVEWRSGELSEDGRDVAQRLRYERIPPVGEPSIVERTWRKRSWRQAPFRELALAAGFDEPSFRAPTGGPAEPDAGLFVALLRPR